MLKITWEVPLIQSVNCVSQDMSVLPKCLVSYANQLLVQKTAEILYAYWYILHFFICMSYKGYTSAQ